ncbi:metalloproteinase inhibitor 2 [Salmo salar]|uniref:Metalloproteinase inhibitor 2 n=1 Tax=Salmo salar TaxID=8030 RepID=A0A1S3S1P2_SALSA|nr:metalloproteinase inhibitor 2 [Salmo salar]|eukprot:XP_014058104.1 PREDICTED: metalloproteinase inhibitor 2-like [Salmo salar]
MTRYVSSCFFTLFVLFLWRVEDIAEACRCLPQHPQQAFCDAEIVIRAKVVGKKAVSNNIKYDIQQIKMFKGCDQVIHAIFTDTTSCGVTLEINKEYLFTGKLETGRMYVTMCGYNPSWENLSAAQKNSLTRLYKSGCDCKIIRCTSLPCPISTSAACLWTDLGTDNGQNLACIKREDGSCAWYTGMAQPKK